MRAIAPGKLVLSGAYSVLVGAPAITVATDRYAAADTSQTPAFVTSEVQAAIDAHVLVKAPWFDASALRTTLADGRDIKLGLGSSAAILVASIAAAWADEDRTLDRRELFSAALAAHRKAQGGGSGIDVAASTFGGALLCTLKGDQGLHVAAHYVPEDLFLSVFASPHSASTQELLGRVEALQQRDAEKHKTLLALAHGGADVCAAATNAAAFLEGLRSQASALAALGQASGAPIFTTDVTALANVAAEEGALFYPSGAGGGDVAIYAGLTPHSERFKKEAEALGRFHLEMTLCAAGVHIVF